MYFKVNDASSEGGTLNHLGSWSIGDFRDVEYTPLIVIPIPYEGFKYQFWGFKCPDGRSGYLDDRDCPEFYHIVQSNGNIVIDDQALEKIPNGTEFKVIFYSPSGVVIPSMGVSFARKDPDLLGQNIRVFYLGRSGCFRAKDPGVFMVN